LKAAVAVRRLVRKLATMLLCAATLHKGDTDADVVTQLNLARSVLVIHQAKQPLA